MKFSEADKDNRYRITGYDANSITINYNQRFDKPFMLTPEALISDWSAQSLASLTEAQLEPLLKAQANVILIGTGKTQQFPSPVIWQKLVANGVGFEVMTTDSACRTYNVLLGDARKVVAAFFFD